MERLGFGRTEMEHLWTVLSAVLNLGNVQILPDPSKPVGAAAITREQPVHVGTRLTTLHAVFVSMIRRLHALAIPSSCSWLLICSRFAIQLFGGWFTL